MIRINLLPFRAAKKVENIKRQLLVVTVIFIVVTGALFYVHLVMARQIDDLNAKINATTIALNSKKKQAAEVDRITKELEVLRKKTEVIVNLALDRKEPVILLDSMTKMVIEKRMWFLDLESKTGSLDIRGVALDNKTVADFMTRLEESPFFRNVRLQSTRQQKIGDHENLKAFDITMNRVPLSEIAKQQEENQQTEETKKS